MRRDLDQVVEAIQKNCRSLYLLNFKRGLVRSRTLSLVENTLARGVGRLMVTSMDGRRRCEEMRGLPGSWDGRLKPIAACAGSAATISDRHRHDADGEERGSKTRGDPAGDP
jgi:hypothetical protein